jgi:putative salt-induced outer membrane protein YdiY
MRSILTAIVSIAFVASATLAQDKVTLDNGDVLTGKVKTMADGKLTVNSAALGDVVVPMANVKNLQTAEEVQLRTTTGDLIRRRILGIDSGTLRFDGTDTELLSNLDKINPPEQKDPEWTGALKLGAGLITGNTERRSVSGAFDAELRRTEDRLNADAQWDYAQDQDRTTSQWNLTQRRTGGGLKYDRFITETTYALATTRVLGDTLADLDMRWTAGVGYGFQLLDSEDTKLTAEAGISYLTENYRSGAPSDDYVAARLAYKLRHTFNERTKLIHGVEAFPSTEDSDDVYFQATTELRTNLTDSMIGSIAWVWDYDNTPAPTRERSDHRVLLTVGWSF